MPIYEYQCRECDHRFEILQRMGKGSQKLACPNCDRKTHDKQFSIFSGSVAGNVGSANADACGSGRFT